MSSIAPDRLLIAEPTGHAPGPAQNWRLTAEEAATAIAGLKHATAGWAALLAECAGLVLGYGEDQFDTARYRQIAELGIAAGVDETLIGAWIEVGRQRATTAAALTHKACVLGELTTTSCPGTGIDQADAGAPSMAELPGHGPAQPTELPNTTTTTESTGQQEPQSRTFPHVRPVETAALTPSDRV